MTTDESQLDAWPVEEQAAYWLRVLADEPTPENHAAFDRWIEISPAHITEFAQAQELDKHLHDFVRAQSIDVDALVARAKLEQRSLDRRAWGMRIAAVCGIVVVGSLLTVVMTHQNTTQQPYATTTRQELIHLDDGSKIALNAQSAVRTAFSTGARDVHLVQGEALFRVRHHSRRPFRVHAGAAIAEALGTEFDVRVTSDRTVIAVVEGIVEVTSASTAVAIDDHSASIKRSRITAGFSLTVHHNGRAEEAEPIDPAAATAWRCSEEQLEFTDEPLAAIARTLNRYSAAPKLTIEGDDLAQRRYTLALQSPSSKSLISMLAEDNELEVVPQGDDVVIRQRND